MDLNFLIIESDFCKFSVFKFVINYCTERLNNGLNLSYVYWIICGTRVEKIKRIFFSLCYSLFSVQVYRLHALHSSDLFHWRTTDEPIYIWYVESMSLSVQNNKFEYINITKIALNYKKIEVQRSVDLTCVVKRCHIEYHW